MLLPSTAALIRGMENHNRKTGRFWQAYARLVLAGRAPNDTLALGEALQRKHQRAVVMVGRSARQERLGNAGALAAADADGLSRPSCDAVR